MRGKLIVFEGIDRSGKSTQVNLLKEALVPCIQMSFPNRNTIIASTISAYLTSALALDDQSVHLLFAANRWECVKEITENISNGINVVLDRYAYSGVAYSAAKGLDLEWCKAPDSGLPRPDLVIYMRVDPEKAKNRADYGEERYEKIEFQSKVAAEFDEILLGLHYCACINADNTVEAIAQEIFKVQSSLNTTQPLGKLW